MRTIAVIVAATCALGPVRIAAADPVFTGVRTTSRSLPSGETLTATVRWKEHGLGGGGGVPYYEFECDSQFIGPATSVAQKSAVACYADGLGPINNGVSAQMPGPVSVAVGVTEATGWPPVCVQALTYYVTPGSPFPDTNYVSIPVTCYYN